MSLPCQPTLSVSRKSISPIHDPRGPHHSPKTRTDTPERTGFSFVTIWVSSTALSFFFSAWFLVMLSNLCFDAVMLYITQPTVSLSCVLTYSAVMLFSRMLPGQMPLPSRTDGDLKKANGLVRFMRGLQMAYKQICLRRQILTILFIPLHFSLFLFISLYSFLFLFISLYSSLFLFIPALRVRMS